VVQVGAECERTLPNDLHPHVQGEEVFNLANGRAGRVRMFHGGPLAAFGRRE